MFNFNFTHEICDICKPITIKKSLLKKHDLDVDALKSYRPVSNGRAPHFGARHEEADARKGGR